ncbi:retina-specific copper amine oxidase isoform X1 [Erpetoichthys calabaricus]|uniref:Amine oxidase n=1 Tax=Erpetoichthys calabaricus TaxID=27687 RepID=A0A8C4TEA1_ERPCA|nr:retina-specific copper amine oxidase isoform X1 [Erpetoichthys calabaricus]
MNATAKYCLGLLLLASLIANVVFICMQARKTPEVPKCSRQMAAGMLKTHKHDGKSLIFSDLSAEEHTVVKEYLMKQADLKLTDSEVATLSDDYIFLIELHLPEKELALRYLDSSGPKPPREAKVVVFHGSRDLLVEYIVGPLPKPTYHRDDTIKRYGKRLQYSGRPVTRVEYGYIFDFLATKEFPKLGRVLQESFAYDGSNFCFVEGMPRGLKSGDRASWYTVFRKMSGIYLHPVGLEIRIDHSSKDPSGFKVLQIFYNGQYFNSSEELRDKYEKGNIKKIVYQPSEDYASLKPRRPPSGLPPQQYEMRGRRYSVQDNQVLYLDWGFAFGLSSLTGMYLFDIRFKGERIAYEVSVQEAIAMYGSSTPAVMLTKYVDSSFGIGRLAHELVRGVDCPYHATFVDTFRYLDTNQAKHYRNSICIFEHNMGRPLRRHFSDFFINDYGGLVNSVLIIRTITAIANYDYIWDFVFYQNGALEVRVFATGYISSAYLIDGSLRYGHQVAKNTLGTLHTHFVNFKADLDVTGTNNYFLTKDMAYHEVQVPWSPERRVQVPKLVEKQLKTENEAALRFDQKIPRYLHIASNKTNKWGHNRSYRIQVLSFNGDHLPESVPEEAAVSWARYKVAITKHKDHESTSSSLYNQNDMWSPAVNFSSYINGESIENEDLVAWISTGFLHIPHAEDIPNTVTAGNGGGFFLRPHNYFDEDPSINSPDSVYLDPSIPSDSCELNPNACLQNEVCMPNLPAFTYNGFDEVIHI